MKKDAARLAVRMEGEGKELSEQNIEISEEKAKLAYNILKGVYESGYTEASKVFDCNIRAASDIAIDKFWIVYDKKASWSPVFQDELYHASGNIGDLLDEYELIITEKKAWTEMEEIITVESRQLYNMKVLIEEFKGAEGILDIFTRNSEIKPDSDIQISFSDEKWNIAFIKKWSSLKDSKSHRWMFEVNESDFKAKFKGESGDIIPDWMSCELNIGMEN